jgi:hypothetical protein
MCLTRPPAHPDPQLAPCPRPHPADSAVRHADAVPDLEFRRHSTLVEEETWLPLSNDRLSNCKQLRSCPARVCRLH